MRRCALSIFAALGAVLPACATGALSEEGGTVPPAPVDPGEPDVPGGWTLEVDTRATSAFVAPDVTSARIEGLVIASERATRLSVAGIDVPLATGGAFTVSVPAAPGLVHVPIEAFDGARHTRRADRSLLVASFLEEGALSPAAASLVLSSAVVEAMAAPLQDRAAAIDIATEIRSRPTLTDDDCVTRPTGASHGTPRLRTFIDETGSLILEITIPSLEVSFEGTCDTFLSSTDVTGEMSTHVVMRTQLWATPGDTCAAGLEHGPVSVELTDFDLDIRGGSGLFGLLVTLGGELREGDTADALRAEFAAEAEALLDAELGMVRVFDEVGTRALFGVELELALCLTGLVTEDGVLRAIVGSSVRGPGLR
nr:hypothetical protein [Myxococcota bacterium]